MFYEQFIYSSLVSYCLIAFFSSAKMLEDVIMLNLTKNGDELIKAPGDFPAIIVITCMLSIFSVVGTTGNAFVLYVFSKKKDKNTSTVFILALASIDFVTCIFVIPFTIFVEYMYKKVDNDAVCKIYQFFITSNVPFSAFIMVAIAIDRYLCICRPWVKIINIKVAKRIILCLLMLSLSLGLITSLAYGVYHRKVVTKVIRNVTNEGTSSEIGSFDDTYGLLPNCTQTIDAFGNHDCVVTNATNISHRRSLLTNSQLAAGLGISVPFNSTVNVSDFVYTGFCFPNEVILSVKFRRIYQKIYATLFLIAFITVFILYAWIYKSILTRRSKRLQSSLTEKRPGRMRSSLLATLFSRKSRTRETIIMVANNSDVNKNNQENGKVNTLHPMRSVGIETTMPMSEITYCGHDSFRTELTRATSAQSLASDCRQEESHYIEHDNSDETSPLNEHEGKLQITSNNLSIPTPSPYNKRKRAKKNGANGNKFNNLKHKQTNKHVKVYDDKEQSDGELCDHKDNYRTTICNVYRQDTRKSVREKHRLANIKTAGILFIVTIVFVIAFLPAWLMATKIIVPPNMIIFYTYFIYNVANPVIYAFFNQTFQKEMKTYLNCSNN